MATTRRRHGVTQQTQSQYPVEVAQPIHNSYLSVPQSYDNNSWAASGNFVHADPLMDNSPDSIMAPPPTTLSLTVPNNSYTANSLLYSPSSDGYSQGQVQEQFMLPSYGSSFMDGNNGNNSDWSKNLDPALYGGAMSPSESSPKPKFENETTPESEVKIKDLSIHSHSSPTTNMTPRQRAAHRKAIEEKSSMKRKLAEQRLSKAVTTRLGGTFVPGLANQMNQAADIIERDAQTIQALEAELNRLRKSNSDVQMKYHS